MKRILLVLALSSGLLVTACNTVEGAGKDIKSVGECADGRPGNCWLEDDQGGLSAVVRPPLRRGWSKGDGPTSSPRSLITVRLPRSWTWSP